MSTMIRDVMHRGVVTCKVTATVEEMARIMIEDRVPALVVTDERNDACGIVTKTDLLRCYGKELSAITAEDIMSSSLFTVSPDAPIDEAIAEMLDAGVHQLVVVSEGGVHHRPVGIFTIGDALPLMID